jgi:hypothetical protein
MRFNMKGGLLSRVVGRADERSIVDAEEIP